MTFNKKEHLQRHERTHTLARPYVCDFDGCGKTFARRDTLTRHTRLHKKDDDGADAPEVPSSANSATGSAGDAPAIIAASAVTIPKSASSSSLRVPRPARKRRARNGSASSTLNYGEDSADDPGSSSAEADNAHDDLHRADTASAEENNAEEDEEDELPHGKARMHSRLQSMTLAQSTEDLPVKKEDSEEEYELEPSPFVFAQRLPNASSTIAPAVKASFPWQGSLPRRSDSPASFERSSTAFVIPHSRPHSPLPKREDSSGTSASALGLDIGIPPAAMGGFESSESGDTPATVMTELPAVAPGLPPFVHASPDGFRIFRNEIHDGDNLGDSISLGLGREHQFPYTHQQQQLHQPVLDQQQQHAPSAGPILANSSIPHIGGGIQQSFLAGSAGSPDITHFSQLESLASSVAARQRAQALAKLQIQQIQQLQAKQHAAQMQKNVEAHQSLVDRLQRQYRDRNVSTESTATDASHDYLSSASMSQIHAGYSPPSPTGMSVCSPLLSSSFAALAGYAGSSTSPTSDNASLPSLSSSYASSADSYGISPSYYSSSNNSGAGGNDISAFKNGNAFDEPMTMGLGMPILQKTSVDTDSKHHLYMLMRAAEAPTEDFLKWPSSRDASPAFEYGAYPGIERGQGKKERPARHISELNAYDSMTMASSNASDQSPAAGSPFLDFGSEYDAHPSSLFGANETLMPRAHSPIASLEEWLTRQGGEGNNEMVVF